MLTFQILDGGETYYRPLEDRSLTVGSAADADICVASAGAAVRLFVDVSGETCRIRVADDAPPVQLNGDEIREADLALGDRLTMGDAVLVLGTQVQRPATAADVLTDGRRRVPFEDRRSGKVKRMYTLVALGGIAVSVLLYKWGVFELDSHLPLQDREQLVDARRDGRFAQARGILDRLEREWVGEDAQKRALLGDYRRGVEETAEEFAKLRKEYMARVLVDTKAEQLKRLKELSKNATFAQKEAARILRAGLTEFRIEAEKIARATSGSSASGTGSDEAVAKKDERRQPSPPPEWLEASLADIRKLHSKREHVQAWERARQILPDVPAEHAEPLLDLLADIRTETRREMQQLVDQAQGLRNAGRLADGVKLLQKESIRFPTEGELSLLFHVLGNLSAELGVGTPERRVARADVPRPVVAKKAGKGPAETPKKAAAESAEKRTVDRDPTGDNPDIGADVPTGPIDKSLVAKTLVEVRTAESVGEFTKALSLLDKSIENHSDYQPQLARYLRAHRSDLAMIRDLAAAIAAKSDAVSGTSILLVNGERATVKTVDGQHVHVMRGGKLEPVSWFDLHVEGAASLAAAAGLPAQERLGAGALGYRQGDADAAEAYLAKLVSADGKLIGNVSVLVARGRGEVAGAGGYTIVKGRFVAKRWIEVEQLGRKFARKLARIPTQSPAEREKVLEELRATEGDGVDDAIVFALRTQLEAFVEKLARSKIPKQLERLRALREDLDKARGHARELIFDREKYFYPYKPPAVSGAKHSEYMKVQKDVDARVAVVRKLWLDKTKVVVGPNTRKEIAAVLWVEDELGKMGEISEQALARVEWVRSIPPVAEVTIRNYCKDASEVGNFTLYSKIEELNEALSEDLGPGEIDQVEITNSYRIMFGHRPLAISRKLHKAAHGHADEMSRLGYFSHTSPTEDRKTPYVRMRNEGYQDRISENIAGNPSAAGAHDRWCHSSGHHRNLLNAGHTEFGVGNVGRLWVQNFGRGKDFLDEADFPK